MPTRLPRAIKAHQLVTTRTVPWFTVGNPLGKPKTVLLVLHGLGQRASVLARHLVSVADDQTLLVVPEALGRALPQPGALRAGACWSTGEDAEADLADNTAWLNLVLGEIESRWAPEHIIAVGFSQGGLTLARWLAWTGEQGRALRFHQAFLWGASLPDSVDVAHLALGLGTAELVLALGDTDALVTPDRRAALLKRLPDSGTPGAPRWRVYPYSGGHALEASALIEALRVEPPSDAPAGGTTEQP